MRNHICNNFPAFWLFICESAILFHILFLVSEFMNRVGRDSMHQYTPVLRKKGVIETHESIANWSLRYSLCSSQ